MGGSVSSTQFVLPETKPTNPKDLIGCNKLPLSLVPPSAIAVASLAHLEGALKYGKYNWRTAGVKASIYLDACLRHVEKWASGEEIADDSGIHHLGHAMACLNILYDAQVGGNLIDDRGQGIDLSEIYKGLEPHVKHLRERFECPNPTKP